MEPILRVDQVSGGYLYRRPFLKQLSFSVHKGEMVGLIGLNGAGKSTTMKHILGLMEAQEGRIELNGATLAEAPDIYRSSLAYIPEAPVLYDELTVSEHLRLTAMAYGIPEPLYKERSARLLRMFRMEDKSGSLPVQLSKGMKQKVMLMNAFLAEPPLYLIDEPFLGLDPLGIRSLLELMDGLKRQGASLLVSSHILSTIENYCDRFVVLHHGRLIAQGTKAQLAEQAGLPGEASLDEVFCQLVSRDEPGGDER